jgi:hypothetical protein
MAKFVQLKRAQVHARGVYGPSYPMSVNGLGRIFYSKEFCKAASDLFQQAEEAVKGADVPTRRVQAIHTTILAGMLTTWKGIDRDITAGDRAQFAQRLAEYLKIRMGDGKGKLPAQADFIWRVAHLRVKEPWAADPLITRLLADPAGTLEKEQVRWEDLQQEVPGGWQITLDAFTGYVGPVWWRWMVEGKSSLFIYGNKTPYHTMDARLFLKEAPKDQYRLEMEGLNGGSPSPRIRISINGQVLFEGQNKFVSNSWSRQSFPLSAGTLRRGENVITIENLEPTDTTSMWFAMSECKVLVQEAK